MRKHGLKVGELAKRTGLTVRALHHYDEVGLIKPSLHTEAGHRLYTETDVVRLQQVLSLRELGFSLEEARDCLDRPDFSPLEVIRLHIARLREHIERQKEVCERLEGLTRFFAAAGEVSADQFIQTIEAMTKMETYYTPEQLAYLKNRRDQLGEEGLRAAEEEWPKLIAAMKAEMEAGTSPGDPKVQALAKRWGELVEGFTGGDPGVRESLNRLWNEQGPKLAAQFGSEFDPRLFEYVQRANVAAKHS